MAALRRRPGRRGLTIVAGGAWLAVAWGLSHWTYGVEDLYARRVGFWIARAQSAASGFVPFSLAEFVLLGAVVYLVVPNVRDLARAIRRRRGVPAAGLTAAARVAAFAVLTVSLFYLCWGLNYARAPLAARLGWTPVQPADAAAAARATDEIARFAGELVDAANAAYRDVAHSDDLGRPSARAAGVEGLDTVFDASYARVQRTLGLETALAAPRGPAKPLLASGLVSHLQISGVYFPWTGEANYNRLVPAVTLPHTIAHEKAHQRGIAREDEANFLGYLACVMSDDAYVRYSGYLFGQRQLIGELASRDRPAARALVARRLPGVQRDVDDLVAFWQRYEGEPARMSAAMNDRYLRAQGVRSGIASYAASRNLIVLYGEHFGTVKP